MKKVLIILGFAAFSCGGGETSVIDSDDPFSICTSFDETDRQMLDLIAEIEQKNAKDKEFQRAFTMEQVYWIQYRDSRLKAIYPKDWSRHYRKNFGEEVFNPCKCLELNRMTLRRIEELNLYLEEGPKDQMDCPSKFND